jgi:hypothetical protein
MANPLDRCRWEAPKRRVRHQAEATFAVDRYKVEAYEVRMGLRPRAVVDHSFSEVTDYWLEHRAPTKRSKKDDQSMIRRHLLPAFGDLLLSQLTVERIDEWRNEVEVSPKTLHNILTLLIFFLRGNASRWYEEDLRRRLPGLASLGWALFRESVSKPLIEDGHLEASSRSRSSRPRSDAPSSSAPTS